MYGSESNRCGLVGVGAPRPQRGLRLAFANRDDAALVPAAISGAQVVGI